MCNRTIGGASYNSGSWRLINCLVPFYDNILILGTKQSTRFYHHLPGIILYRIVYFRVSVHCHDRLSLSFVNHAARFRPRFPLLLPTSN